MKSFRVIDGTEDDLNGSRVRLSVGAGSGWLRDGLMKLGFADLPHAWIVLTGDQAASFAAWTGARQPIFVLPNTVAPEIEQRMGDALPHPAGEPLRVVVLGRLDIQQKQGHPPFMVDMKNRAQASWTRDWIVANPAFVATASTDRLLE